MVEKPSDIHFLGSHTLPGGTQVTPVPQVTPRPVHITTVYLSVSLSLSLSLCLPPPPGRIQQVFVARQPLS